MLNLAVDGDSARCVASVQDLPDVTEAVAADGHLKVRTTAGSRLLPQVIETLVGIGVEIRSAEVKVPNLGGVYLHYTGHELADDAGLLIVFDLDQATAAETFLHDGQDVALHPTELAGERFRAIG